MQQAHQSMLRGQYLDMKYSCANRVSQEELNKIHSLKTGALIKATRRITKAPQEHIDTLSLLEKTWSYISNS